MPFSPMDVAHNRSFSPAEFQQALQTAAVGRYLVHRSTTESTMALARREAEEGAPHGTLVLAEEQTAGRGRRGRSFFSPPGENLYFTLVLRLPIEVHGHLPIAVPVAICEAVAAEGAVARIKWPNDIWVGERKVSGMLIDAEVAADGAIAMPGIGINVNGDPALNPELRDIATSLARELGRYVDREQLLARVCNWLEPLLTASPDRLIERYREHSMVIGRGITVQPLAGVAYDAVASGIEPDGSLRVTRPTGEVACILAGDVSIRPRT
jgi:BirA family biotin operon repressor/biotin-[acetyl-CoA-carboxylase] ligase